MTSERTRNRVTEGPPEIGSYFESDHHVRDLRELRYIPPSIERADAYLETGRQALAMIANDLVGCGITKVLVPGYLCESMLQPFLARRITVSYMPVDPHLQINLERLKERWTAGELKGGAVLMTRYFGYRRDPDYVVLIDRLQQGGIPVVEDLTHALFDPTPSTARYTFASLRKLLPLSSGAALSGINLQLQHLAERVGLHATRWGYMDSKRGYVTGLHQNRDFYAGLVFTEQELEADNDPRGMDARSKDALTEFDYIGAMDSRKSNFQVLVRQLAGIPGIRILNSAAEVPTHAVVATHADEELRRHLARKKIYCPVHWPRPMAVPASVSWVNNHFSIPLDQRYTVDDMVRVAAEIRGFLEC